MPRLSWLMDLLLGIAITYGVLYALLVIDGGRLKFFDAAGILLGAWLFLKTLGRLLFPLFLSLFRAAGMLLRLLASPVTKNFDFFYDNLQKNTFQLGENGVQYYGECGLRRPLLRCPKEGTRMRFKRSSLLTKLLILVLVAYATVTLVTLQSQITEKQALAEELQTSIDATNQENLRLEQAINALGTDAGVEAVARQKLGLVAKGEIIFYDVELAQIFRGKLDKVWS